MSDKPSVYEQDGRIIYRASALGGSIHCLVAARLGYEPIAPPQKMLDVFQAGNDAEPIAMDALRRDDGWHLYDQQKEVALKVTEKIYVVGHIDAKGVRERNGSTDARIVEVKSQGSNEYDSYKDDWSVGLFPRYAWQTSVYQIAEGLGLLLVRFNRDTGEFAVDYRDEAAHSIADIRRRVLLIEAQASKGELPNDVCSDYPCPFFYTHLDDRIEVDDPQVESLAQEYKKAQRDEKTAKSRKKDVFTALRVLAGKDRKLVTEGGWKVTFYDQRNPHKHLVVEDWLSTLAVAIGQGIVDSHKIDTWGERVRITEPKSENEEG